MNRFGQGQRDSTPTDRAYCPVHGIIQARGLVTKGSGRVQWTCPACRREYMQAHSEGYQLGFSYTIPKCSERHLDKGSCFRPSGHGGEVHQSDRGVWPIDD